ncbi:MAG TPA: DEAD/DEAH box helicase [Victivallales bacterium]|nr:DEAD/DEAH box helicase [Victivallales bacterium]
MTRLKKYGGVIVADSVGLGKTYIALKVIENFHLENRKNRMLIVCPAQLRELVWKKELKGKVLPEYIVSQEEIASDDYLRNVERTVGSNLHEIELVVVDESHNFRNPLSKRWEHLFELINEKIAADGKKPKILFLTATPINNSIWDLYWQLMLMFGMNDAAFLKENIPSLQEFFKKAESNPELLNDILNEISVRRTRDYIIKNYPDAYIGDDPDRKIRFPQRVLENIDYELEKTYKGMYSEIFNIITEELTMAYYKMLTYKKATDKNETFELGRMVSIGGIFQTILLKRLESSVGAFKISIKRQLEFLKILKKGLESGKFISKSVFSKIRNHSINLTLEDIEEFLESENTEVEWEEFNKEDYRFDDLINDIGKDIKSFQKILDRVETITPKEDSKLNVLKDKILELSKNGQIVLFAYYADTLNYIFHEIKNDEKFRNLRIDAISSSGLTAKSENQRQEIIEKFINGEIDVLFSTDVLSEGQNLQTAKYIINYDLHWNPTRMVQRAGRIDRIGSPHRKIYIYNRFPERELEELLNLLMILQKKIRSINESYGLDGSILGEEINPKVFGVIRSIKNKDENVLSELENETFAGGERFYQPLKEFIRENAIKKIESIPYGVHSGIHRGSLRGIFFYYKYANDFHYWYLYDIEKDEIKTNKTEILDFISCDSSEPRHIPDFFDSVYDINKKIIKKIEEDYKGIYVREREQSKKLLHISPSTKFMREMINALHFEIEEHLYEFPGDTHLEEKFHEIERNLPRVKLTKKRTKELRRIWREYKKHRSWEKMLNDLYDFVELKYVKQDNERMEEFDKSKLKLITIDFIS